LKKSNIILILYWLLSKVTFNLIGQLILSELFSVILFPFYSVKKLFNKYNGLKSLVLGFGGLLFFQIISDIINHSTFNDFSRGWSAIIFSCLSFITLSRMISIENNGVLFSLFSIFFINVAFGRGDMDLKLIAADSNYFKVRYTPFLNPFFLIVSYFLYKYRNYLCTVIWFLLLGFIYFYFDARSNGLFYFFTGLILFLRHQRVDISLKILSILILLAGVVCLYLLYVYAVLNFNFGGKNAFSQLSQSPNPYNPIWLLVRGRSEVIILFRTIYDNPIFGCGSWGKDTYGLYSSFAADLFGLKAQASRFSINPHSIIFGYWAFAGFGGLVSILFIYFCLFKMYLKIYKSNLTIFFFPIVTYFFCEMNWMFFFSPIGEMRVSFPFMAALILLNYNYLKTHE
jgi:hypothetical protein